MVHTLHIARYRLGLIAVAFALLGLLPVSTALAEATPFSARFHEATTFSPCPQGPPPGAMCYTGVGHGPTVPPGDPNATEEFAGYVVFSQETGCGPDYNVVRIITTRGTLYLTTVGVACAGTVPGTSVENGTWTARGGTGIFEDASGSGLVTTTGTFNQDGTVTSDTTYGGTLILHSGD